MIHGQRPARGLELVQPPLELLHVVGRAAIEPTQLVLAWVLSRPPVASVIVGASRPEQVEQNAAAVDIDLPADTAKALQRL